MVVPSPAVFDPVINVCCASVIAEAA